MLDLNLKEILQNLFVYDPKSPLIFTNSLFWYFFGFVLLVYQFIYTHNRLRNIFLLIFSIFFYYKSSGFYFVMLLITTLIDFFMGKLIFAAESKSRKKLFVAISVSINLLMLSYFKYAYFFTDILNDTFHTQLQPVNILAIWTNTLTGSHFDILNIILPVGISFYTFQSISYSVDIYRGKLEPVKNFLDFAFFVSFFPQLVAGPIVRAIDFVPQIYKPFELSKQDYNRAIFLIINGLIKKILISDYISGNFVDRIFETPVNYTGFENLMAVYGYTIQIYCDFSGYTDIAIGVALLLGFRLNLNFNSPYSSFSITDFWRRWHISLSTWLRDYLYISLGGNRKGKFRTYLNLFITMVLGGLWHGASIKFIIWGTLHGVALAFHKFWLEITKTEKSEPQGFRRFIGQVITFHFVAFCWIYFRAENLTVVNQLLERIAFHFEPELIPKMLEAYRYIFFLMAAAFLIHWMKKDTKLFVENLLLKTPDFAKAFLIALVILGLYQVKSADIQPFIYFQF
jgi:D-alanyl-lipoteichoic acid acyltransferase DltB (MBOAT superfamily)